METGEDQPVTVAHRAAARRNDVTIFDTDQVFDEIDSPTNPLHNAAFWDSTLPLEVRVNDLISRLTLDEKIGLMPTQQKAVPRLGISAYNVGGEAAHGLVRREGRGKGPTTVFPQPIGLSCSWDEALLQEVGSVIGDEARAYYEKNGRKFGLTLWAPTIDMERDPRWGRTEEAYGEDPYLTGKLSSALITGMQGTHPFYLKMSAAPKHFLGNNNERDRTVSSSSIDPRNMREYYLSAFKPAMSHGGALSMMTAYNSINGTPAICHPLLATVVRREWGFSGFVVCDGTDMHQTVDFHHYCDTYAQAVGLAIKAGVDCITDDPDLVKISIREALDEGLLVESDLDNALRRVFYVRFRLGQFDPDALNPYAYMPESVICSTRHSDLARKAVRKSIVLLKNEKNTLPIKPDSMKRIAVVGPLADVVYSDWYTGIAPYEVSPLMALKDRFPHLEISYHSGFDTIAFQSVQHGKFVAVADDSSGLMSVESEIIGEAEQFELTDWGWGRNTIRSRKNGKFWSTNDETATISASASEVWGWFVREQFDLVPHMDGSMHIETWNGHLVSESSDTGGPMCVRKHAPDSSPDQYKLLVLSNGIEDAVQAAKGADAVIVCLGNHPLINGKEEIDRTDLTLPPSQEKLLQAVHQVNSNTILVFISSYPVAAPWADQNIPAIVYSSHGGQELGTGLIDILSGVESPAGRLNMTWYRDAHDLPDIMDYDIIKGNRTYQYFSGRPLYPFGYGLSYSTFEYLGLQLDKSRISNCDQVAVTLTVQNTGTVASDEVVQLYVRAEDSHVKRPRLQLKGFSRISLQPGEKRTVSFSLPSDELSFWDVTRRKFCVEQGPYTVMVGPSSDHLPLSESLWVDGEMIPPRNLSQITWSEDYDDYFGVVLDESKEGGTAVSQTRYGDWILFSNVDFVSEPVLFEARVANFSKNCSIEIRFDEPNGYLAGICDVPATGGPQIWTTTRCRVSGARGRHDVYLRFTGSLRLSYFQFV